MQETIAVFTGLASLAFVTSITPGPNNFMLMTSGMRFGLRASLPHMLGVAAGFSILLAACSLGLGVVVGRYPLMAQLMAWACAFYLVWLADRLVAAPALSARDVGNHDQRPMGLLGAASFQLVNPKAWSMAIAGAAMMAQSNWPNGISAAALVVVFEAIGLPCSLAWTVLGSSLRRHLTQPHVYRRFALLMAALLLATAVWMVQPWKLQWPELVLHSEHPALAIGR